MAVDHDVNVPAIFVISMDRYAGNFERPLTAFSTGMVGECGVGDKEVTYFDEAYAIHAAEQGYDKDGAEIDEYPFEGFVTSIPDDHGCYRPCSIWQNDDGEYNAVAIFFTEMPKLPDLKFILSQAYAYAAREGIKIKGAKFIKREVVITDTVAWKV